MKSSTRTMSVPEVALRFAVGNTGEWLTLVVKDKDDVPQIAHEFAETMKLANRGQVCHRQSVNDIKALLRLITEESGILIISGLDAWPPSEWEHLDQLRSRLARRERTALVVEENTFQCIARRAPNFSSWLGANVVNCMHESDVLTEEEREQRLCALRSWAGLTDIEVISRAEAKELPLDPEFAEWLVLLHRGDLIHG